MSRLEELLDGGESISAIATHLDGLTHQERVSQVTTLRPKQVAALYQCAEGCHVEMTFFVPDGVAEGTEVVHHGINTLPVIGGTFRKRFARDPDDAGRLLGFNDSDGLVGANAWFTGPGYFVVRPRGCDNPDGRECAQLFVDYYEQPSRSPVQGWPDPKPPLSLTAALVWAKMCDYMWRVSAHVSVGAAFKAGKAMGQHFALVRED